MLRKAILAGLVVAVLAPVLWFGRHAWFTIVPPASGEAAEGEPEAFAAAARRLEGHLVWSSTRSGNHDLHRLTLADGDFRLDRLTENPHVDTFPRFSPDGEWIVFNRSREPWVSFRDPGPWDVWIMRTDGSNARRVSEFGYHPTFAPDGRSVLFDRGGKVVRAAIDGSGETVIYDAAAALRAGWIQEPELRDGRLALTARGGTRAFGVVPVDGGEFRAFDRPGCQIAWWPGRDRLVWIRSEGHGGNQVVSGPPDGSGWEPLLDLPGEHSHEYFPRLSQDGAWMVLGASASGHEHDRADYEIFLWKIGEPAETALRLTRHSGNDQWPDLWVSGAPSHRRE